MDVLFESARLANVCNSRKELRKKYGDRRAKRITTRLSQLRGAPCLADLREAPGRCHELTADRAGQLSVDLDHPYRLIFRPEPLPGPRSAGGGLDWARVESVVILGIFDTH